MKSVLDPSKVSFVSTSSQRTSTLDVVLAGPALEASYLALDPDGEELLTPVHGHSFTYPID